MECGAKKCCCLEEMKFKLKKLREKIQKVTESVLPRWHDEYDKVFKLKLCLKYENSDEQMEQNRRIWKTYVASNEEISKECNNFLFKKYFFD